MNLSLKFLILLIFLSPGFLFCQTYEQQEARVQQALQEFNRMRHDRAHAIFEEVKDSQPFHPMGPLGALATRWLWNQMQYGYEFGNRVLHNEIDEVVRTYRQRIELEPENTMLYFYLGTSMGLKARLLISEKDWFGVLYYGYKSILYIKRAAEHNPENRDIKIAFGVFNYYVGLSSNFMKIASWILAVSGSKEEGLQQMQLTAEEGNYARFEARSLLAYIYLHFEGNFQQALHYASWMARDFPESPYYQYLLGVVYLQLGDLEKVQQCATAIKMTIPVLPAYSQREYTLKWHLLEGGRAFYEDRFTEAEEHLTYYAAHFDLELDLDLSWAYLLLGRIKDLQQERHIARQYYKKVVDLDNRSYFIDVAKTHLQLPYTG